MGDLTENFSRHEFACPCGCGFDTVDFALLRMLQTFRDFIERRIKVTSACRCLDYNRSLVDEDGNPLSSDDSQHVKARAADIVVDNVPPDIVYEYFDGLATPGLGGYSTFTHVDTRTGGRARW